MREDDFDDDDDERCTRMDDKQTSSLHELNSNPLNLNSKSVFSISKLINTNHQIIQFAKKLENPELLFKDSNTSILSRTSSWSHTIANQHLRNAFVLFPPKYEHRVKLIIEENEMESPNSKSSRLKSKSDTTFDRSSIASSTSCLVYPPKSDKSFDDFNNKRSQSAVNKTPASSSTSSSSSSARTRSSRRTPRSKSHATNKSAATKESKETKTPVCNTLAPNTVAELQTPKLNKNLVESNRDDFKQSISNITADASSGANATMSSRSDSSDETNKNKRSSTSSASSGESVYMSPMSSSLASSHQAVDQLTTDAAAKNMPVLSSTLNMQAPSSSSSMRQENALALANASTTEQQAVSAETPKADRPCSTSETTNSDSNQQQQQHQQVEIDRQVVVKEWQICADSELMMLRRIDHGHPGSKSKTSEEINRRIEADNRHLYGSIDDFFNSLDDYTSTFSSASASLNHANETETRTDLSHTASDEPDSSAALSLLDADSKLTNDEDTQHTNATCDDESSAKRHASKKRVRLSEAQPTVMLTTTTTPANPAATNTASSSSLSATAPSTTSTTATSPRFPHTSTKSLYAEIFTFFGKYV